MSTGVSCRFDLRLLKEYGLSLNTRKRYFIVYCPMTWTIEAVYDDPADALKHYRMTVDDWHLTKDAGIKGFFPNLSVWKLLSHLHNHITDKYHASADSQQDVIEYTLNRISDKMQCYPHHAVAIRELKPT